MVIIIIMLVLDTLNLILRYRQ